MKKLTTISISSFNLKEVYRNIPMRMVLCKNADICVLSIKYGIKKNIYEIRFLLNRLNIYIYIYNYMLWWPQCEKRNQSKIYHWQC